MDRNEYLQKYGVAPGVAAPAAEIKNTDAIAKKREELELKKLEIELEKLTKPDTSIDYYSKMLELQEKSFSQQMEMLKQQGDLRLEIEKLKLEDAGDSEDFMPLIKSLLPLLPSILANKNQTPQVTTKKSNLPTKEVQKVETPTTAGELQEYIDAIRSGEITYEEALEDFKNSPYKNIITEKQFKARFEQISKGKTI